MFLIEKKFNLLFYQQFDTKNILIKNKALIFENLIITAI